MQEPTSTVDYSDILLPILAAEKAKLVEDSEWSVPTNFIISYLGLLASQDARDSQGYSGCHQLATGHNKTARYEPSVE